MAASDKRRRAADSVPEGAQQETQPENESDSGEGGDSDDMLDDVEKEVQVDFEAVTPTDSDFNGIKQLLQQLFLKAHVNLTELTDLLIKQNYVCSVVKQSESPEDDEDDMDTTDEDFGVISIVNLTSNKEMNCVKQIKSLLLTKCKENGLKNVEERLQELIGETATTNVGLLLSERFINIPPQIALPLYESLDKDLRVAKEKGKPFHFDHFIFICKVYKDEKNASADSIIYANAEEELLAEESDAQFDYSVAHEIDTGLGGRWTEDDETLKPYRRVLVVPANKWETLLGKLRAELLIKT